MFPILDAPWTPIFLAGITLFHPWLGMLAIGGGLFLIGFALVGEGVGLHIPKGYIYFAMAFSVMVEMLNLRMRGGTPVKLRSQYIGTDADGSANS